MRRSDRPLSDAQKSMYVDIAGEGVKSVDPFLHGKEKFPTGGALLNDNVNHPKHYTSHPSGVEVIQITEHLNFCLGNAVKYILRADLKDNRKQDLEKAVWYLNRELERT